MTETLVRVFVEIYSWAAASLLMILVTAIALFYQKKFGVRTFYYFYFVPIVVLLIAAIHLFSYQTLASESIELMGSITSFLATFFLYRKMIGVK